MSQFTLSEGRLFGAFYETLLYGINIVLLLTLLCLFAQQKKPSKTQRVCTSLVFVIFLLCTIHLVSVLRSIDVAFFRRKSADQYFNNRRKITNVLQNAAYGVALILSDGLMIHRLYVIFHRSWAVIIAPGISLIATIVSWIGLIYSYRTSPTGSTLYSPLLAKFAPTAFILSFFTNVIITVMISVRLMLAIRSIRHLVPETESFNRRFLAYTVESGLLYPMSVFVTGVLYFMRDEALEILSGANMQLLCMVPIMLSLQMRLNLSIYDAAKGLRRSSHDSITAVDGPLQFRPMSDVGLASFGSTSQVLEGEAELTLAFPLRGVGSAKDQEAKQLSPEWCPALPLGEGDITEAVGDHAGRMSMLEA
ncbi:predicted protein [Sparassis crispa]|uniref:Uncharacterized protein n=1 Tax=Sparassis crispa TaxID=139825 RepID=A0A401GLK2_9APHY|nr:predicted protein [Sparassis crispa]GBE83067.1 predicted protein [Sparassis crispa]